MARKKVQGMKTTEKNAKGTNTETENEGETTDPGTTDVEQPPITRTSTFARKSNKIQNASAESPGLADDEASDMDVKIGKKVSPKGSQIESLADQSSASEI